MEAIENIAINKKQNKVGGFGAADALGVLSAEFLSEALCRMWILRRLHPDGAHCPKCGAAILLRSFWEGKRVKCDGCGKFFTALTGTFLSGCHMDFRSMFLLAILLSLGLPDKNIGRIVQMSAENVRLWRLKFKEIGE